MAEHRARCQCGQLSIGFDEPAEFTAACSCRACQRRSGSPYGVGANFLRRSMTVQGAEKTWTRTGDSGRKVTHHFCPDCGTTLYWSPEVRPQHVGVPVGALETPAPRPSRFVWAATRLDWAPIPEGCPVYDGPVPR